MLELAKLSRSSFYYLTTEKVDKNAEIKEKIEEIYHQHKGRYGYRRITLELRNQGLIINHKKVYRLMAQLGLKSMVRIKKYRSYKGTVGIIAPNVLRRNFTATKPNEKWTTDITELALFGQKVYISSIIDLYNGEIVCYDICDKPRFVMVENTLKKAKRLMKSSENLMLHSDQGWHYQKKKYREFLSKAGVVQSMSRKGNCLDNAVIENFFGILKSELLYLREFDNLTHFIRELHEYIEYYNNDRIKTRLKMSPVQFRKLFESAT